MIKNKFGQCPLETAVRDLESLINDLLPNEEENIYNDNPLQLDSFWKKLNKIQIQELNSHILCLQGIKEDLEESIEDNLLSEFK